VDPESGERGSTQSLHTKKLISKMFSKFHGKFQRFLQIRGDVPRTPPLGETFWEKSGSEIPRTGKK
jgi:hypothetical protein